MAKKNIFNPKNIIESSQLTSLSKALNTLAALLIIIIGIRYIGHDLIAPVLLALFFTVLMYPIFRWFRNKGINRGLSLILMILAFFISAYLLVAFFTWSFGLINESLGKYVTTFKATFSQIAQNLGLNSSADAAQGLTTETANAFVSSFLNRLAGFAYYFIFIPILSFMIIIQVDSFPKDISQKLLQENPGLKRFQKFAQSITVYVENRFKVNLITGILFTIGLIIIGIDYPFVWGLSTVILSFIPYIGVVIAAIAPATLALATGQPGLALLVVVLLIVVDIFAENIFEPYVQGRSSKISMATVVIALIFWSWLLGFIGAIMAVPLTVLLKTILADYPETRWIAALMEGNYTSAEEASGKPNRITRFLRNILPNSPKT